MLSPNATNEVAANGGATTVTVTSFDAAPVPDAVTPRTRTKYWPASTPPAVNEVAILRLSKLARSLEPATEPA